MTFVSYLAVITVVALSSEAFEKTWIQNGSTHVKVVPNEHLFSAGNDSTGTAAITFTSRLDPEAPTINQFINHSFPHSCVSHPTRCRVLTRLSHHYNSTNHTRLIFYVPLTALNPTLGLMEFWYNGEMISQNTTTRIISDPNSRPCDPVSVLRVPKIGGVYLICVSGDHSLVLCEVMDHNNVSSAWLSCKSPQSLRQQVDNLLLFSNFVIHNATRPFILYFIYSSDIYQMTHYGAVTSITSLQPSFHCRYTHLASVNASFLIGHCYEQDQLQTFYFYLDRGQIIWQEDAPVAHYHCPNPKQVVTITASSQASFQDRGIDRGRFNLNTSQVIFAECFNYKNQTHFLYQDSELGVFIKPNISVDLRSRLVRVSDLRCRRDQACKQPLIFDNRYLVLTYDIVDLNHQRMAVFDLRRGLKNRTLSLVTNNTAQIAFVSEFTKHISVIDNDGNTDDDEVRKSPSPKTIGVATGVPGFLVVLALVGITSLALILIRINNCKKREVNGCRPYVPVACDNDAGEIIKLKDFKISDETGEPQTTCLLSNMEDSLSPTPPPPDETIDSQRTQDVIDPPECVVANLETLASHNSEENISQGVNMSSEELASEDLPHRRSQYSITGASQDDVPASQQCTQPSVRTYIAGCGSVTLQQMNATSNLWGSPPKNVQSYGMPLLECNESLTTSTSTVHATQVSQVHHTIRERPPGLQRQSSLPNPPRPQTLVPHQLRLRQSPQVQRPNYNTNTMTNTTTHVHSLTPDNDLEYQRQQQQWQCQLAPTPARMNSSDSTNSTLSQISTMSTRTPPADVTLSLPDHAYVHASSPAQYTGNYVVMHQPAIPPTTAATSHHARNFHRLNSRESANSVVSLTPESKPESGGQTGSMLVTGT